MRNPFFSVTAYFIACALTHSLTPCFYFFFFFFVANQVLVIDPRLFRREFVWRLLCGLIHPLVQRFAILLRQKGIASQAVTRGTRRAVVTSCLKIAKVIVTGSRSLGIGPEKEAQYDSELRSSNLSLIGSATLIFLSYSDLNAGMVVVVAVAVAASAD